MFNILPSKTSLALATLFVLSSSLFAAGYILPNGTIVYDDSSDHSMYRVDHITPVQAPTPTQTYTPIQTTRVIIEDRVVTYDRPVIVRERIIDRGPVYDIVDATGTVIVYGLLYDSFLHGFYPYRTHGGPRYHYDHYRR